MANAGRGTGSTSSTTATRTATTRTSRGRTPGRIAITSFAPSTATSRMAGSSRSRSPATCSFRARSMASRPWASSRPGRGISSATPKCRRRRSTARSPATSTATTWSPTRSSTFNSLTVQCAQCHNHKFDPITQEDYYSLQAVFAAVDRADKPYDARSATWPNARAELQAELRQLADGAKAARRGSRRSVAAQSWRSSTSRSPNLPKQPAGRPSGRSSAITAASTDKHRRREMGAGRSGQIAADRRASCYVGCHDDFNSIGAGFGFPVRFKIEVSDDPEFKTGVTLVADHTQPTLPNPGIVPQSVELNGRGRPLRARHRDEAGPAAAERLHLRAGRTGSVLDRTGRTWPPGATVDGARFDRSPAALAEDEPGRWLLSWQSRAAAAEELVRLKAQRDELVATLARSHR